MEVKKRFLTAKEIALYLGLSEDTIRKWVVRGKIPHSKFGKSLRFDLQKIEPWIEKREVELTSKS
jgi:excisionase family DNA binding protein